MVSTKQKYIVDAHEIERNQSIPLQNIKHTWGEQERKKQQYKTTRNQRTKSIVSPYLPIISLNDNGPNPPIKRQ